MGIPPHAWCTSTSRSIGEKWEKFISIDEETSGNISFSRARILVLNEDSKIVTWIKLNGLSKNYNVKLWEELG